MPGFNAQQLQYNVQNSNNVVLLIGDQVVGFGQSSSFGTDYGTEGIYGIGNAKPQEIQQLKFSLSVTIDSFQLTASGLSYLGQPSDISQVLAGNSFNIGTMDASGNPLRTVVGCVAQSNNLSMAANQPITEAVGFIGMDLLGPDGTSILNAGGALTLTSVAVGVTTGLITPT